MIVLFDVNGTLTDPGGLGEPWGRPDLGRAMLDGAIHTAMTDVICGAYRPFLEHVRGSVTREADRQGLDPTRIDAAVQQAGALDPWPDAAPALRALRDAGIGIATLTNSGAEGGRATLRAAGLLEHVDAVLGVDAVKTFKPDVRTYRHALSELGARPDEVTLVAAHGWDVAGAAHAGLRTAWVARGEGALSPVVRAPDHRGDDLAQVVGSILEGAAR